MFYANPYHKFRIVVAYNCCKGKPKGLKTIYQQQTRYIQKKGLKTNPREMFKYDFCKQCHEWAKQGDSMLIFMDVNDNILKSDLIACLTADGILEEFSHKFYGNTPPNTFIRGTHMPSMPQSKLRG